MLLVTEQDQPVRMSDVFGTPRNTPIGNPWLGGYWDDYAAREAAFQNPLGKYTSYGYGPPDESQVGAQGAIRANSDVYGPRSTVSEGGYDSFGQQGSYPGYSPTAAYDGPNPFSGLLDNFSVDPDNPFSGALSAVEGLFSDKGTTPGTFDEVGDTARNIGKGAGVAGLLGGGPIAWGVEGLAGLAEMSALNDALSAYGKNAGIQNAPQIGLLEAIGLGLNPTEDLRSRAQNYFFDPNELGDVWSDDEGFDITEDEPDEGFAPGLSDVWSRSGGMAPGDYGSFLSGYGWGDEYGYADDSSDGSDASSGADSMDSGLDDSENW